MRATVGSGDAQISGCGGTILPLRSDGRGAGELLERDQRRRDDLIHVEVLVLGEPADEGHVPLRRRERRVLAVQLAVVAPRDRIERIAVGATYLVLAAGILAREPGATILYNLICSRAVPEVIRERGGVPVRTRVGHSFIKATTVNGTVVHCHVPPSSVPS